MEKEKMSRLPGKSSLLLLGLAALALLCCSGCGIAVYQSSGAMQTGGDDVQYLANYGEWMDVPPFGTVWRPDVVAGWEPFYYGHWVWTFDGWTWVSYEPYGWLVYHYGYWNYDPGIGWFWVPGDTWSPATVEWCTFGDYTAWAPLPPPNVSWPEPWEPYDVNVWVVVNMDGFTDENVGRHRIAGPYPREVVERQTVIRRAPDIRRVEVLGKRTVPMIRVRRQTMDIRPQAPSAPPEQARPGAPKLKKMVLPDGEKRKVKRYAPQVEREVLIPKKTAPTPQQQLPEQPQGPEQPQAPEKPPEVRQKTKTRGD